MKKLYIALGLLWFICGCNSTQAVVTLSGSMTPSIVTVYEIDIQNDGVLAKTKDWQTFLSKKNTRGSPLCRINMHTRVKPYTFYLSYDRKKASYIVLEENNKDGWRKTTYRYLYGLDGKQLKDDSMVICFASDHALYTYWYVSNTPQLTVKDIYRTGNHNNFRFLFMSKK